MDTNQYQRDMARVVKGEEVHSNVHTVCDCVAFGFLCCLLVQDVYETFNILMRRKPKENNFKVFVCLCVCVCVYMCACVCVCGVRVVLGLQAVLETIRALMNAECVVPDWLHDTFLGYGDPSAANYARYNREIICIISCKH